jgi:hypothetical protein
MRSTGQNKKFHATCRAIAASGITFKGRRRSVNEWKVLMVSAHALATGLQVELVEGLEGELVNLRESTAHMDAQRSASLIEYTLAWCAQNDVRLPADGRDWPEELTA